MTEDFDGDDLNRRAFYAIRHGFSRSVAGDLIALLRSGVEIAPEVREEIAAALDGGTAHGIRLTVSGNVHGSQGAEASDAQRDALSIIAFIADTIAAHPELSESGAIKLAAERGEKGKSESIYAEYWRDLRPIYLDCLAQLERGIMGATLDQPEREGLAMSFAYGQLQRIRRSRRKPHKGIGSLDAT